EELKGASEGSQKLFFEETYGFLADRYGEKNVLAVVVHNDEKTPHMHFSFVPVTFDEKKQR
ncbi:plasmid recombination protein, partial [Enterococcus faecalis]|uniref:plasmid recombination protein n=1 Tax=Enterococcus faecalis TaxID=1351 RepID=UPI003ED97E32